MTDIPKAREILREIAGEIAEALPEHAARIKAVTDQLMTRNRGLRQAPVTSPSVSPEMRARIRAYAARHPTLAQHRIATVFGVNPGRVSEALKEEG